VSGGDDLPLSPAARAAAARAAVAAQRLAMVEQLRTTMPAAMAERAQWLLWKFEHRPDKPKPLKMPYWANGRRRQGVQGGDEDRAALVPLDVVLQRLAAGQQWSGIGFAFLPGDGLIGVDVDHAIDPATGQPSELCRLVVDSLGSYTELSPSGTGVHVIVAGEVEKFKDDLIGLEVYATSQYFTCTGQRCSGGVWPETPAQVMPADPLALAYLRELVDKSKAQQAADKAAAAQAAAPLPTPTPAPRPAPTPAPAAAAGAAQPVDDFKRVNDVAMGALGAWVPALLPEARAWSDGFRVTSKDLGRDLQEDLSIKPAGIKDFGLADMGDARGGKRTPVDLVLEYGSRVGVAKPAEALRWLAGVLGVVLSRPQLRRVPAPHAPHGDSRGDEPMQDGDPSPEPPPDDALADAGSAAGASVAPSPPGRKNRAPARGKGRGAADDAAAAAGQAGSDDDDEAAPPAGSRKGKKLPGETWELVDALCERFALVYGSDTAWDRAELMLIRIPAMRLAFRKTAVNLWLDRPAPLRRMVRPADLVFEPGSEVPPPQINMFAGLDLEPVPCDVAEVQPMLDLLRHLCGETRIEGVADPVAAAMHWVLCWQAIPVQQVGTKMATACVFHGAQGTGKNLYWDAWRDLFGLYGVTVGQTELEDKYNGWISRKLACLGDEVVSRQELYHNKNRLKLVVTQQEKFAIRGMFQETRWESNHANVVFLSNENTPLVLEDRDRRYMVIFTPLEAEPGLYQRVRDFLAAGGLGKWLHYLQQYDVGDFTAHTKPPMTKAKEALIEASWRSPARFAYEWLEGFIELPVRVCSAEQLYRAFRRWCDMTGAKWPPEQSVFTTEVNRWVRERVKRGDDGRLGEPMLVYKQIALKEESVTRRRTVRCFLPRGTGPLNGVSEGAWAWDSVRAFEDDLHRFCRRSGQAEDEQ